MIREDKRVTKLPSINLLEDVLTRDPDNPDGVYPFDGMSEIIDAQFSSPIDKAIFDLQEFLEFATEFNPAKVNLKEDEDSADIDEYATFRIEDFISHQEYIYKWAESQCVGFKLYDSSPFKAAKKIYGNTLRTVVDEDGEKTSEAEWIIKDRDLNSEDFDSLLAQAIFYFKLIWKESVERRVNLISFLIAYDKITHSGDFTGRVKPSDFASHPTFKLKGNGVFAKEFIHEQDNKGDYYRFGRAWVTGDVYRQNNKMDTYCQALPSYKVSRKLLAICEQLGFPLREEDPYLFDKDYIESMTCTYIPTNEEYISIYGDVDRELNYIFQSNKLFTVKDIIMKSIESSSDTFTTEEEYIMMQSEYIADCFDDVSYATNIADYTEAAKNINEFFRLFLRYGDRDLKDIVVTEGEDYIIRNNVVMLPPSDKKEAAFFKAVLDFMPSTGSVAKGSCKVFIHATGNAVLLNNRHTDEPIHYVSIKNLISYLRGVLGEGEYCGITWSML